MFGHNDLKRLERAAWFWIIVGVLAIAAAVFLLGRCSARYTVKVQVQPTQENEAAHDAQ